MSQTQKRVLYIEDPKVIKILEKSFTRQILNSFTNKPLTAAEIADAVTFPKDKIYYHIKKLVSLNLLFIAGFEKIKGIEQKKFLPVAKKFNFNKKDNLKFISSSSSLKIDDITNHSKITFNKDPLKKSSIKSDDLKHNKIHETRLIIQRRILFDRRISLYKTYNNIERRYKIRRNIIDRRTNHFIQKDDIKLSLKNLKFSKSYHPNKTTNYKLQLNGITEAVSFVHTGSIVLFLLTKLELAGFQIKKIKKYSLPIIINGIKIETLPELIINVYNQYFSKIKKGKIYLAIHSDKYEYEMTYLNSSKNKNFNEWLFNKLEKANIFNSQKNIFDYQTEKNNNTIVCYSNNNEQIEYDHKLLKEVGLKPRYNTSIPKILLNIHNYYNLGINRSISIIIYIGQKKTSLVSIYNRLLLSSTDISIGLENFVKVLISEASQQNIVNEMNKSNAIHYLEKFGILVTNVEETIKINELNNNNNRSINAIAEKLIEEINKFIKSLKNYNHFQNYNDQRITSIYIGGVGSHIKNIDKKLNIGLEFEIERIDRVNFDSMKKYYDSKRNLWVQAKEGSLLRRQERYSKELELIHDKIKGHSTALETAKSPESAKYRITRLEIDQNSKINSIDRLTKKLIKSAGEFKRLKENYIDGQELLQTDLNSISKRLEDKTEELLQKYKEYDYLMMRMSEIDFENDNKDEEKQIKKQSNLEYAVQIKDASSKRNTLNEAKEKYEKESDDLQINILGYQEKIQKIQLKIESGYDDVAISEYLVNTIQNTAKAFERSLLVHLKSFDRLKKEDLNALKRIGYLLVQNNEKLKEIKSNYENKESNELEIFFDKPGEKEYAIEVRKKLIPVIDLIIQTSENLDQIKNYTSKLININIEQTELSIKKVDIQNKLKKKNLIKIEEEQKLTLLKDEFKINEPILENKKIKRLDSLNIINHLRKQIHETKDIIDNINIKKEAKKSIINKSNKIDLELKNLKLELDNIKQVILKNGNNLGKIKKYFIKNNNDYENELIELKPEIEKYEIKLENIKEEISENSNHKAGISKEINNIVDRNNQINKLKFQNSEKLKKLEIKKIPIIQEAEKDKRNLSIELNIKQKEFKKEKKLRIDKANKTKNITIKSFFKKERDSLEKKRISIQSILLKSTKDMEKVFKDRENAKVLYNQKVTKKTPQISALETQIKIWQKSIDQGKAIQNDLNNLENQRNEWEEYIDKEKLIRDSKIGDLDNNIKRKKKKSYSLFLIENLTKSNNKVDSNKLAKSMVEENIASDLGEINRLNNSYEEIKKRYQLFMKNYRNNHKKILKKLKPFGGQEKIIRRKINNANKKIKEAKRIIDSFHNKLGVKNRILEKKEVEFIRFNKEVQKKSDDIQEEINQIPQKQARAKEEITEKLNDELIIIKEDEFQLKEQYKINLIKLDTDLKNSDIMIQINNLKDNLKNEGDEFLINEINLKKLNISLKNIKKTLSRLNKLEKEYLNQYSDLKIKLNEVQSVFQLKEKTLQKELKDEEVDLFKNQEIENKCNQRQRKLKLDKIKLDSDLKKLAKQIKQLRGKINLPFEKIEKIIGIKNQKKSGLKNEIERFNDLVEIEKDFTININRYDKEIEDLYKTLDTIQNHQSNLIKKINILDEDIVLLDQDFLKIEKILDSNRANMKQIGSNHLKILEKLEEVQDVYFPTKTMLNDRIDNIHSLIEKNKNQKNDLNSRLEDLEKRLKTKRIESAKVDNQLSEINRNMKKVLELSINDDDSLEDERLDNVEEKIQSYVDLVQMKSRTKKLFNDITETEKDISIFKEKKTSINRVLKENENINQKKIKRLEETCTLLEKKIMIDKEELSVLESKLNELNRNASNYGSRIELIEEELEMYKAKEKNHEIKLRELDRSLDKIKVNANNLKSVDGQIIENTIELDYMVNLGLLMDSKNQLNLIPENDKEDYQYFRTNNILRNSFLTLTMVFALATYAQKTKVDPLIELLPQKTSELTLLNMRQDMKKDIEEKQTRVEKFESFLIQDKHLSINMVNVIKYLTQVTPRKFKVTELKLDNKNNNGKTNLNHSNLSIIIKGFYNFGLENSEKMAKDFLKLLNDSKKFKSVNFSYIDKTIKWRTNYEIKLEL